MEARIFRSLLEPAAPVTAGNADLCAKESLAFLAGCKSLPGKE